MKVEKEIDCILATTYFTMADIRKVLEAAVKRDGANPDSLKFDFIRRTDLSANPYVLYAAYEVEGEVAPRGAPKAN